MLVVPEDNNYREVLGELKSKATMNLKCGACSSCTGGGGGKACKCTSVSKVTAVQKV